LFVIAKKTLYVDPKDIDKQGQTRPHSEF